MIIGAGAAGLSAAAELTAHGRTVCILEARERVGGRVLTLHQPGIPVPLELGAEFIHGESQPVLQRLRSCGDVAVDATRSRWVLRNGALRSGDATFDLMMRRFEALGPPARDIPFAEYLERHRRALPPSVRSLACRLVEGFDAADPARVSAIETLQEWSGEGAADAPTFRPRRGYGFLIDALAHGLDVRLASVRLGTAVSEIRWKRRSVHVLASNRGEPVEVHARQAVITLPLGVLQWSSQAPGSVRLVPEPPRWRASLQRLGVGPVVKVVLCFERAFWAELADGRYRDAAFFNTPRSAFPTFWTALPVRAPVLVAWVGGPGAMRLANKGSDEILNAALASLASMFGRRVDYRRLLVSMHWHDWQADCFARGAYSYPLVGGRAARARLARPVDETLFFAGEAVETEASASIGGALASGTRAASQMLC